MKNQATENTEFTEETYNFSPRRTLMAEENGKSEEKPGCILNPES
jgi:hypothetical protein